MMTEAEMAQAWASLRKKERRVDAATKDYPLKERPAGQFGAGAHRAWSDETALDILDALAGGETATAAARRHGLTKNAVLGLKFRAMRDSERAFGPAGDGTMEPGWWRRA